MATESSAKKVLDASKRFLEHALENPR